MIQQSPPVRLLLRGSHAVGLPRLTGRFGGPRLKVLMYHGVTRSGEYPGLRNHYGYNVPVALFEEHIAYLARHCRPVTLDDVLAGELSDSRTNVLVTFDDGYENNFTMAHPVLERHGVPAIFALPTGFVAEGEPLWNDLLERAVESAPHEPVTLDWDGERRDFDLSDQGGRIELLLWLMRTAATSDPRLRGDLVDLTCERLGVDLERPPLFDDPDYRPLDGDQIRTMVEGGLVEFASHSVSHFMMGLLSRELKQRELARSRDEVERLTGRPCRAFCVPGGSYDEELLELASELGYEAILTSDWGWADPGATTLNRCGIFASYDTPRFVDEVHGPVVTSLLSLRRALRGS